VLLRVWRRLRGGSAAAGFGRYRFLGKRRYAGERRPVKLGLELLARSFGGLFGPRRLLRLGRHFRFMAADGGLPWKVPTIGFGLFLLAFLSRLALGPLVPWLGLPLSVCLTAYVLVGLPHWIGVAVRRRRIELARLYS
jgi:hypothetical protein